MVRPPTSRLRITQPFSLPKLSRISTRWRISLSLDATFLTLMSSTSRRTMVYRGENSQLHSWSRRISGKWRKFTLSLTRSAGTYMQTVAITNWRLSALAFQSLSETRARAPMSSASTVCARMVSDSSYRGCRIVFYTRAAKRPSRVWSCTGITTRTRETWLIKSSPLRSRNFKLAASSWFIGRGMRRGTLSHSLSIISVATKFPPWSPKRTCLACRCVISKKTVAP